MAQRKNSRNNDFQITTDRDLSKHDAKQQSSESVSNNLSDAWQTFLRIVRSRRFHIILGVVLILIDLIMAIAVVSFAFVGNADFSIAQLPLSERFAQRTQVHNAMGIIGADIAYLLVCKTFGWASVAILAFILLAALRLIGRPIGMLRAFFACSFWTIWGSCVLALIPANLNYSLGGAHGVYVTNGAISLIHLWGTLLVLAATLIIFLIAIDDQTVPRFKRWLEWCKQRREERRQKKLQEQNKKDEENEQPEQPLTEKDTEENNDDDTTDLDGVIDLTDTPDEEIEIGDNDGVIDLDNDGLNGQDDDSEFVISNQDTGDNEQAEDAEQGDSHDTDESVRNGDENEKGEEDFRAKQTDDLDMKIEVNVEEMLKKDPDYLLRKYGPYDPHIELSNYQFPSISLLKTYPNENSPVIDMDEQQANKQLIVRTFRSFGIEIVSIRATIGPTVTLYEIVPKEGTRINRIQTLEKDIMLSLSANGIRIIAPIPGKGTVGIEVPNKSPQVVSMHSVVASKRFQEEKKMRLPVVMGKTITNEVFMFDLAKTPHLLVAGATGQGKSVGLNAIITSLLYKKHPTEMKLVLVDPKMVEFTLFEPLIRHYMAAMPEQEEIIITDCQKVINTLNSLVIEMEDRYMLLMDAHVRNLEDYNEKFVNRRLNPEKEIKNSHGGTQHHRYLPYLVIIIDEYGDFIMQAGKQVETPIARITQKARAVGMHMILATQRPSVNIVTGVIKANIPTRIAFRTQSVIDSRTVLDAKGAEGLVGKGDMLYSGGTEITRIQCAFVDTPEVEEIVKHISQQQHFAAPYQLPDYVPEGEEGEALAPGSVDLKRLDPMFKDVATYVVSKQEGSTSKLQRAFEIGYNKAGKLSDQLEAAGIVGPNKGPKGRDVLVQDMNQLAQILESLGIS